MKQLRNRIVLGLTLLAGTTMARAQGTAFTYQGRLTDRTSAATGLYDLRFALYDGLTAGSQQGVALTNAATAVSNGFFTVSLNFGTGIFTGPARWLEIAARTNGTVTFTTLQPRQALTASPYALYAPSAGTAALATNLPSGTVTAAMIADGAVTGGKLAAGAVKATNLDDGGRTIYGNFVVSARSFQTNAPVPFESLMPVTTSGGAAPSMSFLLDGATFGTVAGFVGHEGLCESYEYVVEVIRETANVDPNAQLGHQAGVVFTRGTRTTTFTGIVTGCSLSSYDGTSALYTYRIGSPLAPLAFTEGYRIFQDATVLDIVSNLCHQTAGVSLSKSLSGTYRQRIFTVQYAETALNCVNRLLEEEGIYYFFRQTDGLPVTTLGDSQSSLLAAPYEAVRFYGNLATNSPAGLEYFRSFQNAKHQSTLRSTQQSYDFTAPRKSLTASSQFGEGIGENQRYGTTITETADLEARARIQAERQQTTHYLCYADGNAADLRPGYTFVLDDQSSTGLGGTYLVTAVRHGAFRRVLNGVVSLYYGNQCEVSLASQAYRPAVQTPKPLAYPCTAVVVGAAGQEMWTDKYGRVKVQFRWDRYGTSDQNSSGWIRVASPWAGKSFGIQLVPRIGQEVIVSFLEGDPDKPVVTGSLYNGDQMPPYGLPANQTVSGIKTHSSPGGSALEPNELRFEDKHGSEEVYLHGTKDLNLVAENDASFTAGAELSISAPNIHFSSGIGIGAISDPAFALFTPGAVAAGTFQGDGSTLNNLSASALATGTVNDSRLSTNVALRTGGNTFSGAQVISGGNLRLSDQPLYLRTGGDTMHGLGWYYSGTFAGANPDGPVLFGCGGGGLGTMCSTPKLALVWNNLGNVVIDPSGQNGGALTPGLTFGGNGSEGIASKRTAGGNQYGLDFYTYGTNRLSIANAGNVGIGTTNPVRRLHVLDADGLGGSILVGAQSTVSAARLINFGDGDYVHIGENGVDDRLELKAANFFFAVGNVGIGTNSPLQKLHVNGGVLANGNIMIGQYPGNVLIGGTDETYSAIKAEPGILTVNKGGWAKVIIPSGLVGIGKTNPATALDVNGTVTATAFNPPSDRGLKENFAAVSSADVLEKVCALPITQWNFKSDQATPHLGPMAQDFHAAFGLGTDDKHIATVDADGVALAAIQGLNRKVDAETAALRAENVGLKQELAELKRALNDLALTPRRPAN